MRRSVGHGLGVALGFLLALAGAGTSRGDSAGTGETADRTRELIELLRSKNVLTEEEAERFLEAGAAPAPAPAPPAAGQVIGPAPAGETGEGGPRTAAEAAQAAEAAERETGDAVDRPSWVQSYLEEQVRFGFGGDIRVRYQGECYDCENALLLNPSDPSALMNTQVCRHRGLVRARLCLKAESSRQLELGFRLATGNDDNPVSTNETFGNYFMSDGVAFDLAFLKWSPLPFFSLWGGRIPNPWFYTDLLWDPDLSFEGLAVTARIPLSGSFGLYLTGGAFPLQEVEFSRKDKWLFGGQAGFRWNLFQGVSAKVGVAYYDYQNVTGVVNDPLRPNETDWTGPLYQQKGNTLMDIDPSTGITTALAADYNLLDVTAELDIDVFAPIRVVLIGNYVQNLGYDPVAVALRSGAGSTCTPTQGYKVGVTAGSREIIRLASWQVYFYYRGLEADAVLDAFNDSDFHLGGTNNEGWILGGKFGISKNLWLEARWLSSDEISGPKLSTDVVQVDLNAGF